MWIKFKQKVKAILYSFLYSILLQYLEINSDIIIYFLKNLYNTYRHVKNLYYGDNSDARAKNSILKVIERIPWKADNVQDGSSHVFINSIVRSRRMKLVVLWTSRRAFRWEKENRSQKSCRQSKSTNIVASPAIRK